MIDDALTRRLADGDVLVLDGGIGTELRHRGVPMHPAAWAGPAVLEHEDAIRVMHEDYIRAGADLITANTFEASRQALTAAGVGDRVVEVNRRSVRAARHARDNVATRPVQIVGPLFPGYVGADRETLLPDPPPSEETLRAWLREQTAVMAEEGVDVFALEMTPTSAWGRLAIAAAAETGCPVWLGVSFTPPSAPQPRTPVEALIADILTPELRPAVAAVTVMHTEVADIDAALDVIDTVWDGVLGVYPHHGRWFSDRPIPEFEPLPLLTAELLTAAERWVARGVQIVGGCCGVTPEHVRVLRDGLPARLARRSAGVS